MNHGDQSRIERPWFLAVLFLACVALAIAPLALRGASCGQDFDFHFESWMSVVHHWQQGVLYPHWIASANYGAGEPRFVFYPPLSWALGAVLCVIFPWTWSQFAFILVCLLAMGAACYHMARHWMPPATAALAACLYVANPYILFVIYERSALAELLAAAWFPLLFLYALRPAIPDTTPYKRHLFHDPNLPLLALAIALLWLTDAPAGVMGSYALAIIVAVAAIHRQQFALIIRAVAAMAFGLGLSAFYLIPAINEQRWVEITRAISTGLRIQDSFLFEHTDMAYHDQVLRSASWIAVIVLVTIFLAAAIAFFFRSHPVRDPLRPLLVLSLFITLLFFPISLPIWHTLPKLRYLQFPWRWLLVLGLIAATLAAEALVALISRCFSARSNSSNDTPLKPKAGLHEPAQISLHGLRFILPAVAVLAITAITTAHAYSHYWQFCDDQDNIRAQLAAHNSPGFEGTDEYTPTPADNGDIQQGLPPIRVYSSATAGLNDSSVAENPDWQPSSEDLIHASARIRLWHIEHIVASIRSPQPGYAVFRLMDYPAWRIRLDNNPVSSLPQRDDGLLAIPIPAGTSTIDIRYAATPDVVAGRIISLVALALWLTLAAKSRLRRGIIEQNASRTPTQ